MPEEQKKYKTILADPPWDINQRGNYGACHHYDLMSLERIKAMPVKDIAADDAHLWLWVPTNQIEQGFEVARAFGFTPRSVFTWIKPYMGLGVFLRGQTEMLIFANRGKAPILCKRQPNVGYFPRLAHSEKPHEQYAIIERCSPGPYAELFARHRQPGWDIWGLEAPGGSDFTLDGYPVPTKKQEQVNEKGVDHE